MHTGWRSKPWHEWPFHSSAPVWSRCSWCARTCTFTCSHVLISSVSSGAKWAEWERSVMMSQRDCRPGLLYLLALTELHSAKIVRHASTTGAKLVDKVVGSFPPERIRDCRATRDRCHTAGSRLQCVTGGERCCLWCLCSVEPRSERQWAESGLKADTKSGKRWFKPGESKVHFSTNINKMVNSFYNKRKRTSLASVVGTVFKDTK